MITQTAGDIMIPLTDYPHISDQSTLREAMRVFVSAQSLEVKGRKSQPRVLLVFDEADILVGILRRRDILRGMEPDFLTNKRLASSQARFSVEMDPNLLEMSFMQIVKGMRKQSSRRVCEVMIPIKVYVNHDDHIAKVIYDLVEHDISLVPVVRNNKVVGVVRSLEVFLEVADYVLKVQQ